jgi:hypothetical protein
MSIKGDLIAVGVAGAVLLAAGWYAKKKIGEAGNAISAGAGQLWDAAKDATKYVNPTSDQNLAYQGASSLTRWLTGQETGDLGTIAWDFVHKGDPIPGAQPDPATGLTPAYNYTVQQQAADLEATRRLEMGYHGM